MEIILLELLEFVEPTAIIAIAGIPNHDRIEGTSATILSLLDGEYISSIIEKIGVENGCLLVGIAV